MRFYSGRESSSDGGIVLQRRGHAWRQPPSHRLATPVPGHVHDRTEVPILLGARRVPGAAAQRTGGSAIEGELYDVPMENIRTDFLPEEPAELELTVVELADGRSVLAVALRPGLVGSIADQLTDITQEGSWRKYRGLPQPA